ncbi:MAG: hypothetical protein KKB50_03540 [Planctomycetes bacterium]|nr:hypothetical protein [Planctomycetota bacterium]
MDTIHLTPATTRVCAEFEAEAGTQASEPELPASASSQRGTFDGLEWTYRAGAERLLARLPSAAWAHPADQGWERIKHNATREVWRAPIGDATFYLKYYAHRRKDVFKRVFRSPSCEAEWRSVMYALRAGLPAAQPTAYTNGIRRQRRRFSLLVTAAVEPAYPLNDYWLALHSDEDPQRQRTDIDQLSDRLAEMIARAHQSGFEHLDMHAANILVQPISAGRYRTVFVDLHSARLGVPIRGGAVVRNLAQLNQWFRRHSNLSTRLRFLRAYCRWRNEYEAVFDHGRALNLSFRQLVRALATAADRHARRLWAQRDRRTRRSGRYFASLRLPGGWRGMGYVRCKHRQEESRASALVLDREWWNRQLQDPLRWFRTADQDVCKDSHSAMVARGVLTHGDVNLPVIVKRPRPRNWRRVVSHLLPPARALRGWWMGHALLHRNIPAARPLAVLERRLGPLVLDSLLITEAIPGAADLETHLRRAHESLDHQDWLRHKQHLCQLLVRHVRRLQERGFAHRDCKAQNIIVARHPQLKLLWIDMDGLRLVRQLSRRQMLLPLMRLHVSLLDVPGLTRTDRLRFLKGYYARFGIGPRAWRPAWREIVQASEKKIVANQARRAWKRARYGRE